MSRVRAVQFTNERGPSSLSCRNPSSHRDPLRRRNQELVVLNEVASAVSRHLQLKTVLDVTLKKTLALMRVGGGLIYLHDEAQRILGPVAHRGISTALLRELQALRLGESFSGSVAASRRPLIISDICSDIRLRGTASTRRGLHAYAGVPIICRRRKVLGVFALLDRQKDRFTREEVGLLGRIAGRVGVAMENARLYEEAQRELAARKQAETALKESEERRKIYGERLRSLASQLALVEECERRRIAAALHDEVSQTLSLAQVRLSEMLAASPGRELTALALSVHEMISQTLKRARTLTFELSPPVLYELGFCDAVGWLVEQFQKQYPLRWEFQGMRVGGALPNDVRVTLFQCLRELLMNAVKHSHARRVKVRLDSAPAEVCICIEDDGVGFNVDELWSNPKATHGFGLFAIRERIESLGGRLEIGSRNQTGTRVTMTAPLTSGRVVSGGNGHEDHGPAGRRQSDDA